MAAKRAALSAPVPVYSLEEGIERALAIAGTTNRPVVVLEHADRANDSTHGLRALLDVADRARIAVPFLWDPQAVTAAMAMVRPMQASVTAARVAVLTRVHL